MDESIRHKLWIILSDLFLDTDVRYFYPNIVRKCKEWGLEQDQVKEVLLTEVAPALAFNLIDIAGEWAGFPDDRLIKRIGDIKASRIASVGWGVVARKQALNDWNRILKIWDK